MTVRELRSKLAALPASVQDTHIDFLVTMDNTTMGLTQEPEIDVMDYDEEGKLTPIFIVTHETREHNRQMAALLGDEIAGE